jgi:hypothetical protein
MLPPTQVYEYTKRPQIKPSKFKTKPMIAVATWLHAASSCVRLVSDMLGDDLGIKEARQVVVDEEAVLERLKSDLHALENEEENAKFRLRLAIGKKIPKNACALIIVVKASTPELTSLRGFDRCTALGAIGVRSVYVAASS